MNPPFRSKLLSNSLFLGLTQVGGRVVRFFYLLAIAHLLGPAETGIYLYGVALYLGVISIGHYGQNAFLSQRVGKHSGVPLPVLHHSLSITVIATAIVTAGSVLFVLLSESDPMIRFSILCFVATIIARAAAGWVRMAYVAFEEPAWIPKYEIGFRGSEAIFGVAALSLGGGLVVISALHFAFWTLEAWFALTKLKREHPGALALGRRTSYLKKIAVSSAAVVVTVTAMTLYSQIAIVLLRRLQSDSEIIGQFGIAMQFMTTLMIAPTAVILAFLPRLSRSFSRGNGGRDLITAVKLVTLLALGAALGAAAYGPWFVGLVLGDRYIDAANLFRELCWVLTPYSVAILLSQCFTVINARLKAMTMMLGLTGIHVALLAILIDSSPATAAVVSMLVAAILVMLYGLRQVDKVLNEAGHFWWVKCLFVVTGSYAVFECGLLTLPLAAPLALAVGAALTLALKIFDEHDVAAIRRLLGRETTPASTT